jgi:hypothetical protein
MSILKNQKLSFTVKSLAETSQLCRPDCIPSMQSYQRLWYFVLYFGIEIPYNSEWTVPNSK